MPIREINAAAAGSWKLGDLTVNRIGFGAKRLSAGTRAGMDPADDREGAIRLLRRATDLGVNHIDTAAFYPTDPLADPVTHEFTALGWANDVIRRALAPYPDDLVIATKVGPTATGTARPDQLRARSRRTCASSAATISTWSTYGYTAWTRSPSTSARSPSYGTPA